MEQLALENLSAFENLIFGIRSRLRNYYLTNYNYDLSSSNRNTSNPNCSDFDRYVQEYLSEQQFMCDRFRSKYITAKIEFDIQAEAERRRNPPTYNNVVENRPR